MDLVKNIRISLPRPEAREKWIPAATACRILMCMWSFGPLRGAFSTRAGSKKLNAWWLWSVVALPLAALM